MRVSMNWLGSFIDLKGYTAQDLAAVLTDGGMEVGSVDYLHPGFSQVVIGEIMEISKHPNADKLRVCTVAVGPEKVQIVTGAMNVFAGDRVPVALPGAQLSGGRTIGRADMRGVASLGMLCSEKELALTMPVGQERSREGILILPDDAPIGMDLSHYLELDDWVLELELYPNRSDCLAMIHVAREVGTLINRRARIPDLSDKAPEGCLSSAPSIGIEDLELCRRYSGLVVEDIIIEPSPMWIQNRLRAAGVRPINNIVDITNYCMIERGQPLHAFDLDKLQGAIQVRRAQPGEKLTSLDGVERTLDQDMLIIADQGGPVAIAGVMGGLATEVTDSTRRVLFESAHFQGASVRRTSRRLGLRSESSNRFEKGVDLHGAVQTLNRVAELLTEQKTGRPVGFSEQVGLLPEKVVITIDSNHIEKVLGVGITRRETAQVMDRQEFRYRELDSERLEVEIPSYRQDLKIEEDLIEEVIRIRGYASIPTTLPCGVQTQGIRTPEQVIRREARRALIRAGLQEIVSYAFVRRQEDAAWGKADRQMALMNPLREELSIMRTSLIPGLLETAARNLSRQNAAAAMFEIGNVYWAKRLPLTELPDEVLKIAGVAVGSSARYWRGTRGEYDFYYMKGVLEYLAAALRLEFGYKRPEEGHPLLHSGRSAEILVQGQIVGFMGELNPEEAQAWDLLRPVVFELDLARAIEGGINPIVAAGYPRFPAVQRDLAVVTEASVAAGAILDRIRTLGGPLLNQVEIFDVYAQAPIPEGYKSLAFTLRYQSKERTLTDDEVTALNDAILEGIQKEFGAERRK